ncbi:MAG: hypothetical protein P9L94_03550 [Candidatus Hinthialibacter antarcticus]|nr:hypothetical protein [Candidatus Hinthialibacter antarcticus]
MIPNNDTVFLISSDALLSDQVERILFDEFGLNTLILHKNDFAKVLFMDSPRFIIWDGQVQSDKDENLLLWLREHFHGKAIVAILEHRDDNNNQINWYQHGITMFCFTNDNELKETLSFHTRAILEHQAKRQALESSHLA